MEQIILISQAIISGEKEKVVEIINSNQSIVNSYSEDGWTPLHLAAYFGQKEIASFLLEQGADIHIRAKNENENTPLQAAIANKQSELVAFLIEKGSDVNAAQSGGWTGLHEAALFGNEEIIILLLEKGANKMIKKNDGKTAYDIALEKGHESLLHHLQEEVSL
ncbi:MULTISPECIES: ankyrin repeat domain-containing protein [Bacillus]|uniref:ankyrin repeat domain-containing protein n=1 Tax=Bacillus TaxID=1386 RepID=UPI0004688A8A|nr:MULTISPECIES: ankyrin repeat domain-containing protein [Bacillus]MED1410933.1 ankyrin repeat domain-containing protein [Bacillus paramycoides]MED1466173.1 ankyrin repeat domain-containing protein [Bacillus paramycoides]MED1492971.1 ankyrin repeat domain-containing protein [Bacillus paramycoides]